MPRLPTGLLVLTLCALMVTAGRTAARELAVPASELQPAELVAIRHIPERGMALLMLRVGGDAELPIFTGTVEAEAIERARLGIRPSRPLTHELLGDLLDETGWNAQRLVIDALRDGQFLAALELRDPAGRRRLIDTRPSDGLALVLRSGGAIAVARQVVEDARADEDMPPSGRARSVLTAAVTQAADTKPAP